MNISDNQELEFWQKKGFVDRSTGDTIRRLLAADKKAYYVFEKGKIVLSEQHGHNA